MNDLVEKVKHILYRQKTKLLHTSRLARWIKSQIWSPPADGVVTVIYKHDQDINRYFDWRDPDDEIAHLVGTAEELPGLYRHFLIVSYQLPEPLGGITQLQPLAQVRQGQVVGG